jgi:hypothetical protein
MVTKTFLQAQSVGASFEHTPFQATFAGRHPIRGFRFLLPNGARIRILNLKQVLRKVR